MNREILFRGKDVGGPWRYGGIVHQTDFYGSEIDDYRIIDGKTSDDNNLGYSFSVIPETVGQYTGLQDKNGKKIFEGDILEGRYDEKHPDDAVISYVFWAGNGWRIKEIGFVGTADLDFFALKYNKVVGNIHDNPERLLSGF